MKERIDLPPNLRVLDEDIEKIELALRDCIASTLEHDPEAIPDAKRLFGEREGLSFEEDAYAVLDGADALVLVTEWRSFWSPDFERIRSLLEQPVIVDGRNVYDPAVLERHGILHYAVGRAHRPANTGAKRSRSA